MVKTAKRDKSKRSELVEIAEKLFLEKGYEETTVDDILEASGFSKGGFYHYFKSKEELLSASISNLIDDSLRELEAVVEDPALNALEKLKLFLQRKSVFQKPRVEYAKYLGMLMRSDFTLYKFYLSLSQKYVEPFSKIVEQGAREGIFDVQFPRETADILVRMMVSVPQSAFYNEFVQDEAKYRKYSTSLRTVIARVLGIDRGEIRAHDDEAVQRLTD